MLFSTYTFLLLFLPSALAGYWLLGRINWRLGAWWLTGISLFFYAWWKPDPGHPWTPWYLALILASCAANYQLARFLGRTQDPARRRLTVTTGVAANLALLGYFKYLGFFAVLAQATLGWPETIPHLILPLAISFFTFLQIAFLVDVFRGDKNDYTFGDYLLFVTFFPHLIAGPLVHHRELISQFGPRMVTPAARNLAVGLTLLIVGLFKKVVLADPLSKVASAFFLFASEDGRALSMGEAWVGSLAYTFQIYFDFSGYSDMAIGISYLFGLRLPLNFNSPYQAASIVDFWRRWHMTLSRFLRDYLYIPLGGSRKGPVRRYFNLLATMLLGGLWHGSGLSFVIWGFLHGLYLCANHGWVAVRSRFGWKPLPKVLAVAFTFLAVVAAWIPFRAGNFELAAPGHADVAWKVTKNFYHGMFAAWDMPFWPSADEAVMKAKRALRPVLIAALIAFLLPNSQRFLGLFAPHTDSRRDLLGERRRWWSWTPTWRTACFLFALLLWISFEFNKGGEFIYFQF